jgi:hypothetical protein
MKILLRYFNAKLEREDIFKPTIENDSPHSIYNGAGIVNFATSKNLVKSTMFPRGNIRKYTWTSPDGETCTHIDHILTNRR